MEILEDVAVSEVPVSNRRGRPGMWTRLVERVLESFTAGRVTVIKVTDDAEYRKMRNGTSSYWRQHNVRLETTVVVEADGLRVFMELEPLKDEHHPRRPAHSGIRPMSRAAGG